MSTIEKINTQTPKKFSERKQDHGDAASQKGHQEDSWWEKKYDNRVTAKLENAVVRDVYDELNPSLEFYSPAQLEAEADKLLGIPEVETPAILTARESILGMVADTIDEEEVTDLFDRYAELDNKRHELLDLVDEAADEKSQEARELAESAARQLDEIEEAIIDIVNDQGSFPTEAELGVRSRHEIRNEMARRVTLDVSYDEDDNGDGDYHVPVHIENSL